MVGWCLLGDFLAHDVVQLQLGLRPNSRENLVITGAAAKRFVKRLVRSHSSSPRKVLTDRLRCYPVAHRELQPYVIHSTKH